MNEATRKVRNEIDINNFVAMRFSEIRSLVYAGQPLSGSEARFLLDLYYSARDYTLEEVAKWYEDKGWLMDESEIAAAIRAKKEKP